MEISITNCKNISDLDLISKCSLLKKIIIDNGGNFSSSSIFIKFHSLEHFVIMGKSSIIDNNFAVLENKKIPHLVLKG